MLLWYRKTVLLKGENVALDGFPDVLDGSLPALALRNAARKTRALCHPEAIFTGINDYLSHGSRIPCVRESSTPERVIPVPKNLRKICVNLRLKKAPLPLG